MLGPEFKDLKEMKFENGINLINSLARLEEKQKSSLRKAKAPGTDLGKRINPYSKDDDTEFFYLAKKPVVSSIYVSQPNPQAFTSPELADFLDYNRDENDGMKISSLIRIQNVLNFLNLRKNKDIDNDNDEDVLTSNDYAMLDFLRNDEYILLKVANEWLCQEIANNSFYTGSHKRFFAILDEILKLISSGATGILFTIQQNADLLIKFFTQLPLINENVFLCLKEIIEVLKENPSDFLNVDTLLECYQDLLDKFNGQIKAISKGIRYLMDLGMNETIKLVRYKYYPHPSFTNIIEEFMHEDIDNLRNTLDEKDNENHIRHLLAFAHRDINYLRRMFEVFPTMNEKAKKILLERIERFYPSRFKQLDPAEIPWLKALFSDQEQAHELLEKLASYLKLHLPLLGIGQEDQNSVEEILKAYQRRKQVDFFCTLILKDDDPKIDGVIHGLLQDDIMGDVFVHLHRLAIYNDKNIVKIRNIVKEKILEQIPYQRMLKCLEEICQPTMTGQLSPLSGVTIILAYKKFSKPDDMKHNQDLYNELLGKCY